MKIRIVLCVIWLGVLTVAPGCEDPEFTQTQAFEYAEERYREGQYDAALDGYQAFLDSYPTSPLAATAEMRIRGIHREVRAVMMQKETPRPRYVGKAAKPASSAMAADADSVHEGPADAQPAAQPEPSTSNKTDL